ncbi:MAG: hypothetical protein WC645_07930 [Candidatus Margulisiibacteriota bacterium]
MIVGKMDPEKFAQVQAEHRAKMAAATVKRHQAEAAAAEAALAAHYAEAARVAGSYQPFARAFTGLREEFRQSASVGIRRRQNGRWVSYEVQDSALAKAQKLQALGFGQ